MKIVLTGGGTGGHFYPIIAIAEAIHRIEDREHLVGVELYYISDDPYNKELLQSAGLRYVDIQTGKRRTYFSIKNFIDLFKIGFACINATVRLFLIYPDVVFGKGGYASFPTLFAARLLRIPVVIHESDISLGRVNKWAEPFAEKIAISYPETQASISKNPERVALTGIPIRASMLNTPEGDSYEHLKLDPNIPTILVLGGSQGSETINEHIMDIIHKLVDSYQVIHQTGEENVAWMKKRAEGALSGNPNKDRYRPLAYLDSTTLRHAASVSSLVVSRAGSTIFEIALWGKPSILIPLAIARGDHQRENAYSYARAGACTVIEEANLRPELLFSVIENLMTHEDQRQKMIDGSKKFAHTDAADKIAQGIINIALKHAA